MTSATDVIQFNCQACGMELTVPIHMAGVSGPCPKCWATITSPQVPAPYQPQEQVQPQPQHQFQPQPQAQPQMVAPAPEPMPQNPEAWGQQRPAWQGLNPLLNAQPAPPSVVGQQAPVTAAPAQGNPSLFGNSPLIGGPLQSSPANNGQYHHPNGPYTQPGGNYSQPQMQPPVGAAKAAPPRREVTVGSSNKGMALILGSLMVLLALGGTGWFFQDSLRVAWHNYTMKEEDPDESEPVEAGGSSPVKAVKTEKPVSVKTDPNEPPIEIQKPIVPTPVNTGLAKPDAGSGLKAPTPGQPPSPPAQSELPVPPEPGVEPAKMKPKDTPPGTASVTPPSPAPVEPSPPKAEAVNDMEEIAGDSPVSVPGAGTGPALSAAKPPKNFGKPIFESAPPEAKPALEHLKSFFSAKTWQDRLQYVQWPEQMEPLMKKYYADNADAPLPVTHIQLIPRDEASQKETPPHHVFQVAIEGVSAPIPVMVEETTKGWKVDWLTFIEFKDELFKRFLESYVDTPARFHVLVRRTHYFDDDVPAMDKKICFEADPPMPGFTGYIFSQKGTPLAKQLDANLPWGSERAAVVVELQWRKQDRYQWVEMTAVPHYNWRTPGPDGEDPVRAPAAIKVEDEKAKG